MTENEKTPPKPTYEELCHSAYTLVWQVDEDSLMGKKDRRAFARVRRYLADTDRHCQLEVSRDKEALESALEMVARLMGKPPESKNE